MCLKRWNFFRQSFICEICHREQVFNSKRGFWGWMKTLYSRKKYISNILIETITLLSISILAILNIEEFVTVLEKLLDTREHMMKRILCMHVLFLYNTFFAFSYFKFVFQIFIEMRRNMFRLTWQHEDEIFEEFISEQDSNILFDYLEGNTDEL